MSQIFYKDARMMSEYERELFDEFKRLESLCRDMFSCQHGVSEYISQMEQTPAYIKNRIPFWDEDYRTLKHLRWLRNKIAHETAATGCGFSDVKQLKDFYSRILKGQDPLASARKMKRDLQNFSRQKSASIPKNILPSKSKRVQKSAYGLLCTWFGVFLLIILIILFVLYSYPS